MPNLTPWVRGLVFILLFWKQLLPKTILSTVVFRKETFVIRLFWNAEAPTESRVTGNVSAPSIMLPLNAPTPTVASFVFSRPRREVSFGARLTPSLVPPANALSFTSLRDDGSASSPASFLQL